jgi:hypothetical protein
MVRPSLMAQKSTRTNGARQGRNDNNNNDDNP